MYQDGHRSSRRGGDGGSSYRDRDRDRDYRSRSPYARDGDYRRLRKDSPNPPRDLNYDDEGDDGAHDYRASDRDRYRMSDDRYYGDNNGADRHSARAAAPGLGLRGGVPDVREAGSAPPDQAYWHGAGYADPDGPDYLHRDEPDSGAVRLARHAADPGRGDRPPLRDAGGYRHSVAAHRGGAASHDRHGRGRRPPAGPGRAVALDGLPEDATERDVLYGLDYVTRDRHFSSDMVRIARVRHDHSGRCIAFVEFHRRSDAENFYDRYQPDISFPLEHSRGPDSEPVNVGISLLRNDEPHSSRDAHRDDEDWDCINCGAINYPHRAVCYKCKTERPEDDEYTASGPFLTGETDECPQQTPSQYVVVRDLEGSVSEEVLAKGVMKLFVETQERKDTPSTANKLKSTAPTNSTVGLGAKPGSLRRVFLMRDRKTNESWRYGFAEFATVQDAMAAVAKFRASTKFTIASRPVVVAFIHTGVFVPAFDVSATDGQELSFTPIYNPAVRVRYWDDRAYPSVHVVSADPVSGAASPGKTGGNDDAKLGAKPSKKAKTTAKEPAPSAKIAMMPQMQLWAKASAQLHGGPKPAAEAEARSAQEASASEAKVTTIGSLPRETEDTLPDGPIAPQPGDQYLSYADWDTLTCLACDWQPPSQTHIDERGWPQSRKDLLIEHEARAHRLFLNDSSSSSTPSPEAAAETKAKAKAAAALAALGREPRLIIRRHPRLRSERLPVYVSFADWERLRCVLCRRVFKEARMVWLHEQQSEMHRRMLADKGNRARAREELKRAGVRMRVLEPEGGWRVRWEAQRARVVGAGGGDAGVQSQYRDRALERRRAFGQPKQPAKGDTSATAAPGGTAPATAIPEKRKDYHQPSGTAETGIDQDQPATKKSRGAGMLAKMGWTAGAGLGAEGSGRTDAIATEVYAPGVGLGAEGGKLGDASEEAARNTRGGFAGFVEKTRERARERFEKLGE